MTCFDREFRMIHAEFPILNKAPAFPEGLPFKHPFASRF